MPVVLLFVISVLVACTVVSEMNRHKIKICIESPERSMEEIERDIVLPVENILEEIGGLESISSAVALGSAHLIVELLTSSSKKVSLDTIAGALAQNRYKLPKNLKEPSVTHQNDGGWVYRCE